MRLGVSGKVLAAFGLFLLAFAAYAAFTAFALHGAREEVVIYRAVVDAKSAIEEAPALVGVARLPLLKGSRLPQVPDPDPRPAVALKNAMARVDDARRGLAQHTGPATARANAERMAAYVQRVDRFRADLDDLIRRLATAQPSPDDRVRDDFNNRAVMLQGQLRTLASALRDDSKHIAGKLAEAEQASLDVALLLGLGGLLVAVALGVFVVRTLRPLGDLRRHAREVAAGDYGRRTGVGSRDEIGDLAREFDAMAAALEEREQRLIRSERLATVGRMAAQITHEIRNPLASIGLNAELLVDDLPEGADQARRLVGAISGEVERLSEITETYLRFARLPQPKAEREDLCDLVSSAVEFSRAELVGAGITVDVQVPPGPIAVMADEAQIRQALLNLFRNAREAMPTGGKLSVAVALDDGQGVVTVADTGPGIAPEHLDKVWDPFFSTKDHGNGLGLSLVHQIVTEHGGRIAASSVPGQGTRFVMRLPLATEAGVAGANP